LTDLIATIASSGYLSGFRVPLAAGAVALTVSWLLTPWVRSFAINKGAIDDPNRDDRRIHKEPLPRWGGLAIYAGIVIALLLVLPLAYRGENPFPPYLIGMILIGGLLVVVGALDDLYQYKAKVQALLLLGAGVLVQLPYSSVGRIQIETLGIPLSNPPAHVTLGILAIPLSAIYIFVVTKTMDTIDGVDGLASGIATIAATTLTIIAAYGGMPRVAIIGATVAGASLGFLKHNYNPAKIIMGTGGAYILGFTLACASIVGALKTAAAVSLIVPVLVFGVPIFDAFFVVTRRLLSGVPITQADKRHLHHTLLKSGLSQRQTVWVLYAAAITLCAVLLAVIKNYA
jgi:UDP-GlcNAc:undecaprenyl-phosphate GlcNAc-1-phosphate transferase